MRSLFIASLAAVFSVTAPATTLAADAGLACDMSGDRSAVRRHLPALA